MKYWTYEMIEFQSIYILQVQETHLVAMIILFENRKHCRTDSLSLLNDVSRLRSRPLPGGTWIKLPRVRKNYKYVIQYHHQVIICKLPCRTKTWLTSSRISQPSTIIRSTAKFFRRFSVSETSSCICRDKSSSCWRAFCRLFRSTWSCGVWAKSSCNVIMYLGI